MAASAIELALKKQRLQLKSAELRDQWSACAATLKPLYAGADRIRDAGVWLRRHPELLVAIGAALVVARPRMLFRWLRRAVSALLFWRGLRKRWFAGLRWLDAPSSRL
jgi:YqjK-like protein